MRDEAIRALNALNGRFYADQAASFSATRQAPWPGWLRCVSWVEGAARGDAGASASTLRALDLGCGNLRFEVFLSSALPDTKIAFAAADACEPLMDAAGELPGRVEVETRLFDAVEALARGGASSLPAEFGEGAYDAAVVFGFLHHVPSRPMRVSALRGLAACVRSGGVVAVSLWRFLDDPAYAAKADEAHARAVEGLLAADAAAGLACAVDDFEAGDRLLGWQGKTGACRYCHSFSDGDVDELIAAVADRADLVDRFRSDGRTGAANEYLVFRMR